jgi:hypothetical protein
MATPVIMRKVFRLIFGILSSRACILMQTKVKYLFVCLVEIYQTNDKNSLATKTCF